MDKAPENYVNLIQNNNGFGTISISEKILCFAAFIRPIHLEI